MQELRLHRVAPLHNWLREGEQACNSFPLAFASSLTQLRYNHEQRHAANAQQLRQIVARTAAQQRLQQRHQGHAVSGWLCLKVSRTCQNNVHSARKHHDMPDCLDTAVRVLPRSGATSGCDARNVLGVTALALREFLTQQLGGEEQLAAVLSPVTGLGRFLDPQLTYHDELDHDVMTRWGMQWGWEAGQGCTHDQWAAWPCSVSKTAAAPAA